MEAHHPQAKNHKGKSGAVIHTCLAGQTETQPVPVLVVLHLHIGCQDGVGRGEYRPQKDRRAQRQSQKKHADKSDQDDGQGHGDKGEPQGNPPSAIPERWSQFKAGCKKRDEHSDFRQSLQQARVFERVQVNQFQSMRPDGNARQKIQYGCR